MLAEIRIDGLGVISAASARFHPGFTALTGETGAGKTMVVTSLHLLGGARSDAGRVRTGAERAAVEGRFVLDGLPADTRAAVAEIVDAGASEVDEDGSIIAVRTVGKDGRSRAHLGGRSVPIGLLGRLTGHLLAVHGQNDQLRLLRPERRRRALDTFAADEIGPLLEHYREVRRSYGAARDEYAVRTERARELAQESDRLRLGAEEIAAVDPQPGEDDAIAAEVRRLGELDSLREAAEYVQAALSGASSFAGEAEGIADLASGARGRLGNVDDPALRAFVPRLDELAVLSSDLAGDVSGYLADLPSDGRALDDLLQRQAELKGLTRKYAADIDGVLDWARDAEERLSGLDLSEGALAELAQRVESLRGELADAASVLHRARVSAAAKLGEAVTEELAGLAMGKSRLAAQVDLIAALDDDPWRITVDGAQVHAAADGADAVDLLLGSHPSGDPLPIGKTASGGELSRVMLAIEVVLAGRDGGGTLVFDEVDAGVGGRAAVEIGRRLARLARTHQVIVVTHLPQVAAFADAHLVIGKEVGEEGARSAVRSLDDEERVGELARMLAGLDDTETGRAHAEELLATAGTDRAGRPGGRP
ncbi:DNA repair protein RecN [Tomitella cavernea]|uniref:DNA repair protein RecN n=1 Tax=Tomitella cavernea TaxID=1387982 RepID=A0ABP9CL50_9ACTN|nr:DNA repair protein RecN [Tomitella cavernea]